MSFKRLFYIVSIFLCAFLFGCQKKNPNEILVGTIAGPETELMRVAADIAKDKYGIDVKIVEFEDYIMPNRALADGTIDANLFQHEQYLIESITQHQYALTALAKMFIYPMGLYSKRYSDLADLPIGAKIGIPNDPSNGSRALFLLQDAKLITLKKNNTPIIQDILTNPKNINILEMDAAQLPRALSDIDMAAINTNYAIPAGLYPKEDGLFIENNHSHYVNVLVVRTKEADDIKFQHLVNALHSKEVMIKAEEVFKRQAVVGWQQ